MLRLTVPTEEYIMIGDNIKIVFLGGSANHNRIMIDAPKEISIIRGKLIERGTIDLEERAKLPKYYRYQEHPEKYKKYKKAAEENIQ